MNVAERRLANQSGAFTKATCNLELPAMCQPNLRQVPTTTVSNTAVAGFRGGSKQHPAGWRNNNCLSIHGFLPTSPDNQMQPIVCFSPLALGYRHLLHWLVFVFVRYYISFTVLIKFRLLHFFNSVPSVPSFALPHPCCHRCRLESCSLISALELLEAGVNQSKGQKFFAKKE